MTENASNSFSGKNEKKCSFSQKMPKKMLAQSRKAYARHHKSSSFKRFFRKSSILKRSEQTLVHAAIANFSPSRRIAMIQYFPLEVNGGRFLFLLVAFRNTATRRHSEIKQNRATTKQEFSGEAFSKQNIKD